MSNDLKLQENHPLDDHLRPIKVDDEVSALEISKTKVKVKDLEVTGSTEGVSASDPTKLPLAGGTMTGDIAHGSNFALDVEGDISLDANGGEIYLKDDGTTFGELSTASNRSIVKLYENAGASSDDYFKIETATHGSTVLQTVDANGNDDANLTLDADGSIIQNSATGAFIYKNNGVEFSVDKSAYAGMILGYRCIGEDATPETYTLTTSMVTIDSDATVRFTAPPSGNIEVNFQAHYYGGNGGTLTLGISTASTYAALSGPTSQYEKVTWDVGRFDDAIINQNWVITGLTAGDTYNYWIGAKVSSTSGTPTIKWGGDSAGENVPLIIKITALPAATSHFAVYG